MFKFLELERHGAVGVIALNRPEARNALGMGITIELRRALREAAADTTMRALILTGRGGAFSAGADVKEWAGKAAGDNPWPDMNWVEESLKLVQQVHEMPKPTIAMVDGAAVGAGLDMALACDFRYASEKSKFICSYTNVGFNPDCGGTWLLPRVIGLEAAKLFAFTGELWTAPVALEKRLVSHVSPNDRLWEDTLAFAQKLASGPTVAIAQTKKLLNTAHKRSLSDQQLEEVAAGKICGQTKDHAEGLAAANERRAPRFVGA
ncbi:enoyl-CoA hydratase-related protein [Mesorhizobium sp. VK25A]|uniref:Enoyl-CoA hydratase-related protein n=1 Tax=Mesorhizobium vachelliae TaxID=3072309 RepID=A0ABU5A5V7_9HYPH|nr:MULTISPECIES: enoyl-CoA hydratase-related protein [unclassified Mesorhizobium]MDX8533088.1 enoyl-CoA hydratase-related protein [Mesorhizobium sp. VK25D]MDX8545007.1 enoyl-CoA hydratase-related protein [Mesorhizobium sp. VK25A]